MGQSNQKQSFKVILFIIFLFLSVILVFVNIIFFNYVFLAFFLTSFILMCLFGYLIVEPESKDKLKELKDQTNQTKIKDLKKGKANLNELLHYHKMKEELLKEKNQIQKQYMKRQLSEKQFKQQTNIYDKKILLLDYKMEYFDSNLDKEKEIKRTIEFLQKKLFKNEIPEDLYNEMSLEFSKQLAVDNSKKKSEKNAKK